MAGSSSSGSAASSTVNQQQHISTDETQIYDRQIRLWGLEAQNRLRNSSVLLVGLSGLGAEVAKNLMLSGLKSLTLMDEKEFSDADKGSQFLIPPGAKGNRAWASMERVKVLNPLVQVEVNTGAVRDQSEDFFRQFDLVICIDQEYEATNLVNKICRRHKIRFQAGGIFGWTGFAFFDFNQHAFLFPKPKQNQSVVEGLDDDDENGADQPGSSKKAKMGSNCCPSAPPVQTLTLDEEEEDAKIKLNVAFPSFEQTFDVQLGAKKLMRRRFNLPSTYFVVRAFLRLMKAKGRTFTKEEAIDQWKKELEAAALDENRQKVNADDFGFFIQRPLNPVCAIVGSVLSQEAIKALSQNDAPLKNMFLYSALDSVGAVCEISA